MNKELRKESVERTMKWEIVFIVSSQNVAVECPKWVRLVQMGQILDFFRSDFSTFCLCEPNCIEKVPDLSHLAQI